MLRASILPISTPRSPRPWHHPKPLTPSTLETPNSPKPASDPNPETAEPSFQDSIYQPQPCRPSFLSSPSFEAMAPKALPSRSAVHSGGRGGGPLLLGLFARVRILLMITIDAVGSISGLGLQLFRVRGSRALGFRPGLRRLERPIPAPCCSQASSLTLTAKKNFCLQPQTP